MKLNTLASAFLLLGLLGCTHREDRELTSNTGPVTLYVWANPIMIAGVRIADHTWVTTFDAPSACAPPHEYWYSWGSCHATGPGTAARLLDHRLASLELANCICQPDVEDYRFEKGYPPHGGIDFYGISGVCHQLSNRILYATAAAGIQPATVRGARGYNVSRFLYGTYGSDGAEWAQRLKGCGGCKTFKGDALEVPASLTPESDFEVMLSEAPGLSEVQSRREALQTIQRDLLRDKQVLDRSLLGGELTPREFANRVNAALTARLRSAHELLGAKAYEAFFELPPGEPVGVVDPEVAERSNYKGKR